MQITTFPPEILTTILQHAAALNAKEGVTFSYGLGQAPLPLIKTSLSRHVRGPINPDTLRWDSVSSLRQVCRQWRAWALKYALRSVYVRRWRGAERWAELSTKRQLYNIYELIENPSGHAVYREPFESLRRTAELFACRPDLTENVRRLWFGGFFTAETDQLISQVLRSCRQLQSISIPWTLLRHGSAQDWMHLLGIASATDQPLESLELQAICLRDQTTCNPANKMNLHPLTDSRANFSQLKRLKIFGNTTFMPLDDQDLKTIARTVTSLEEFHIASISTVSLEGVLAVVKASQSTLRVLEHSPRSDDGFFHPDPGQLTSGEHICDLLLNCPKLKDLSISVPSVCAHLFSNEDVRWEGECQVRAVSLCGHHTKRADYVAALRLLLDAARGLVASRPRLRKELDVELFFADCIFDPRDCVVHGDFSLPRVASNGSWPSYLTGSSKGPYGSSGLYGKDEGNWSLVSEEEYLRAVEHGWIRI